MVLNSLSLQEDYWDSFTLEELDIEFLYNHLMETETPLTSQELVSILVTERLRRERQAIEDERVSGGDIYLPKERYTLDQQLVFPALGWRRGQVVSLRSGFNPDCGNFEVIQVAFDNGDTREYAAALENHALNDPVSAAQEDISYDPQTVLEVYEETLTDALDVGLESHTDIVRIAGRWFPRALLVDINQGHLNLAEAVLDMAGGGPLPTASILEQIELPANVNPKLLEFSLDLALQEDQRFDEVGPSGIVLWFLRRLEPEAVLEPPVYLRYPGVEYDREALSDEMLALERELDDELSPLEGKYSHHHEADINLIFPHSHAGTLPLASRIRHLFPTVYEEPRIRFTLVDGESGERFPAWVVRNKRYVYGLKDWYTKRGLHAVRVRGDPARDQRPVGAGRLAHTPGWPARRLRRQGIARLTHSASEFGKESDSLADVVSFGVAPAIPAYQWGLRDMGRWGWLVTFLFVVAGSVRLARYNVRSDHGDRRYFTGLAIPGGAGALTLMVLADPEPVMDQRLAVAVGAFVLVVSTLMVSTIPYRSFKDLNLRRQWPGTAFFVIALVMAGVAFSPFPAMALFLGVYLRGGDGGAAAASEARYRTLARDQGPGRA